MTATELDALAQRKKAIREAAHEARRAQPEKDETSRRILARLFELPEYQAARCVLFYVDVRTEVRTRHDLTVALAHGKKIAVPFCVDDQLELYHLENMDELSIGMYKILEPRADLRTLPAKQVDVRQVDLIVVPGVAFDRRGGRMGHGFGYYDKLLERARPDAPLVALAFECQLFPEIPMQPHDVFMDRVLTEAGVYDGARRK